VNVELTQNDLLDLRKDISDGLLPRTAGFCYGQSDGSEIEDDLQFVDDALKAIEEGDTVYYSSWW
jgi:hypothetical protein